jgi:hypothetical protein
LLVILGDLLTYGCEPKRVLEQTAEALGAFPRVVLIEGNHDQVYLDRYNDQQGYYRSLPDWIRESIDWTAHRIDLKAFAEVFPWCAEFVDGPIYFSHANPFAYRDWTYLNTNEELYRACSVMAARGFRLGVFGHTHRRLRAESNAAGALVRHPTPLDELLSLPIASGHWIVNPGSVGQPRSSERRSTLAWIACDQEGNLLVEFKQIFYDVTRAIGAIRGADLSIATRDRLEGYLRR